MRGQVTDIRSTSWSGRKASRNDGRRGVAQSGERADETVSFPVAHARRLRLVGGYRLLRRLGVGGMGEVWEAFRESQLDGPRVAVKVERSDISRLDANAHHLTHEGKLLGLCNHRCIVRLQDTGTDPRPYLVMERVDGQSLSDILAKLNHTGSRLTIRACLHITREIASALTCIHALTDTAGAALEALHRDVSPGNVLISRQGDTKLCDFGLAQSNLNVPGASTNRSAGKLGYMAPEQVALGHVSRGSDIFALGVVLWECITGRRLFRQPSRRTVRQAAEGNLPMPSTIQPGVPPDIDELVRSCLAPDPFARPAATDLHEALSKALLLNPGGDGEHGSYGARTLSKELSDLLGGWL